MLILFNEENVNKSRQKSLTLMYKCIHFLDSDNSTVQ